MAGGRTRILSTEFVRFLRGEFRLDWHGIHGVAHWTRVRYNGLALAKSTGADTRIIELFAFLHDSRRENDGRDNLHGERAMELARELNGRFFELPRTEFQRLEIACRDRSDGYTQADTTVQACWDADRLDLGRVGIQPVAKYLCTDAAKDPVVIQTAYRRSLAS
jgi:uncharacterized protein